MVQHLIYLNSITVNYRSGNIQHLKQEQCLYPRGDMLDVLLHMKRKVSWGHPKKERQFCHTAHNLTRSKKLPLKQGRQEEQLKV
jgi:hypothetical protein